MGYRAAIFDLGGVVLGSPLLAIRAYERELGIAEGFVDRLVASTAPHGAWSRLERGELGLEEFYPAFEEDCRRAGGRLCARTMMRRMSRSARPRPEMLAAISAIRRGGRRTAALTNNWSADDPGRGNGSEALRPLFDVFVESAVEGLRKPDPRIYELVCRRLGVGPQEAVFLDDIGSNLKPARAMGMATIKVADPAPALEELAALLELELPGG